MKRLPRHGRLELGAARDDRALTRPRTRKLEPWLQELETRTVLSTIDWALTTGGSWDVGSNWVGGVVPGQSDTAVIKSLSGTMPVYLNSNLADSVGSLVTDSTVTLEIANGSLTLGGTETSTFGGTEYIAPNAALNVGSDATVQVGAGQTLTDNGTMSFSTGDTVAYENGCCPTAQSIDVGGTLNANTTTFNSAGGTSDLAINSGGSIQVTNSTFNINQLSINGGSNFGGGSLSNDTFNTTLSLPYGDVQYLAGNTSFEQIQISDATLGSGASLALNQIGTNTTNLSYAFLGGFTVGVNAMLTFGTNVPVDIGAGQTFTDQGSVSFSSGDIVTFENGCCPTSQSLVVDGTLAAAGTTFNRAGGNSVVSVNSGGTITPTDSTFNVPLYVPYTDVAALASGSNLGFDQVDIIAGTVPGDTEFDLNEVGSNTANLSFVFSGAFTVALNATMVVGPGVPVYIGAGLTFTDDGAMSLATGDVVTFDNGCCPTSQSLVVNGTLTATGTTFNSAGGTSVVNVASGATITPTQSAFNVPLYVPYTDVAALASGNNVSFDQVDVIAGTVPGLATLDLNQIGTNTTNLSYAFLGGFTVAQNATVAVGPNVSVYLGAGETFTDTGTVSFASGDIVTFDNGCCPTAQSLVVNGTLTADGTTFNSAGGTSVVSVTAGGTITPSQSTFNVPVYLPYNDVAALASGNNVSFDDVEIIAGTITNANSLDLNAIGSNTTSLIYVFPGAFMVAQGGTVAVGPNVTVDIGAGQTFTDDGTVSFTSGDTVEYDNGCCPTAQTIVVGGTMTADDTTFNSAGGTSDLVVNASATFQAAGSTFNISSLSINSSADYGANYLTGNIFNMPIYVPFQYIQYLGDNTSFNQIEINAGSLPAGNQNYPSSEPDRLQHHQPELRVRGCLHDRVWQHGGRGARRGRRRRGRSDRYRRRIDDLHQRRFAELQRRLL